MKQHNQFKPQQQQQHEEKAEQQQAYEFSTTEELLRFDAGRIDVPAGIAQRLQKSSAELPRPVRSWWKRLFGK